MVKRRSISCLGALLVTLSFAGCDPDEDLDARSGYLVDGECVCDDEDFRSQDIQLPQEPQRVSPVDPDDDDDDDDDKGLGLAPDSTMNVAPIADDECICDDED